jgi:tetratricopeptide (TPR) repeat protein
MPYVKAAWRYARAIVMIARGDLAAAQAEADGISAIARGVDLSPLKAAAVPGGEIFQIAAHVVLGRIERARKNLAAAIERFEQAAALQDKLPYMEPPYWYYPVRQSLAAALLQAGRFDEAAAEFGKVLQRTPNSGWVFFGQRELARARGDAAAEKRADEALARAWEGDRALLRLSNL